jgi:hypothetical protein
MQHPQIALVLSEDEPRFHALPPRPDGIMSVAVHQRSGTLQLFGTVEQLLALAAGIKDAVHLEQIVQLGHDVATAEVAS